MRRAALVVILVLVVGLAGCQKRLIEWPDQVTLDCSETVVEGLECVADGFDTPTWGVSDGEHLFILEREGQVWRLLDEAREGRPFLDIRSKVGMCHLEQGLLGMAFHPDYPATPEVFVSYIKQQSCGAKAIVGAGPIVIARYHVEDGFVAEKGETLLVVDQPHRNHNGGHIRFGPDALLWIGLGDGGDGGDPDGNGQNADTLLGSIVTLDVSQPDPEPDTRVIGVRNPWRFTFADGLWIMDVGEDCFEELNHVSAAALAAGAPANLGWNRFEGRHVFEKGNCRNPTIEGDIINGTILPVFEYSHAIGCSITGGPVRNGTVWFGDFCYGTIWNHRDGNTTVVLDTGIQISSFASHADDIYVLGWGGAVYRVSDPA